MLRRFASVLIGVLATGMFLVAGPTNALAQGAQFFHWDIVNVLPGSPPTGGVASALANDGSKITLTSTGTFFATPPGARFVAFVKGGGGTWQTFSRSTSTTPGTLTGSGTYRPLIGAAAAWKDLGPTSTSRPTLHGGLLVVEIVYSDGDRGVLVVSCALPPAGPGVFEGVTATKGEVDYWARQAPRPGVEGNRTVFTAITP